MRIEIARDPALLGVSGEAWNGLAARSETNTVFQTYEWFASWWGVFGGRNSLFLVKAYDGGGALAAMAPLMISKERGRRVLRFAGDEKADYCDFLARDNKEPALERILDAVMERREEWDSIQLKNIPDASCTRRLVEKACGARGLSVMARQIACPALVIRGREREAAAVLRKDTVRRRHNYLAKRGALVFRNITEEGEALSFMDAFFDQHVGRRAAAGEGSLFLDPCNREFYSVLAKSLLGRGWLLFSVLEFDGRPIAFHFGFDYNSKVIWYKPSFDTDYQKHSPGTVLLSYLIRHAVENGRDEFDFTLGDEPFKRRFANEVRMNTQLEIFKSRPGYLIELSRKALRHVVLGKRKK